MIPAVRDCCTDQGYRQAFEAEPCDVSQAVSTAQSEGMRVLLNSGSSASFAFFHSPSPEQVMRTPFLTANQKNALARVKVVNVGTMGASIISSYARIEACLDRGVRPSALLVELHPAALNPRHIWIRSEIDFGLPLALALKHSEDIPLVHLRRVLLTRAFQMVRLPPGAPRRQEWVNEWFKTMRNLPMGADGFPVDNAVAPGHEDAPRALYYHTLTDQARSAMFSGFKMNPDMLRYAAGLAVRARREGIPILFWTPAAHPLWAEMWNQTVDQNEWRSMLADLRREGAFVLELDKEKRSCHLFLDPVHLSARCFPEITYYMVKNIWKQEDDLHP